MPISDEPSSAFEGSHPARLAAAAARGADDSALPQHEADLVHLRHRIATGDAAIAAAAKLELQAEERERARVDAAVRAAAGRVIRRHFQAPGAGALHSMDGETPS